MHADPTDKEAPVASPVQPRISFGVPVFNGERYIEIAVRALQEQSVEEIEIVISDNASDDGTGEICRRLAAEDDRIRYLRSESNRGGHWNYQRVLAEASAPVFSWAAADDVKLPLFAEATLAALDQDAGLVAACPHTQIIDEDGRVIEELRDQTLHLDAPTVPARLKSLLFAQAVHAQYGAIRTEALRATRGLMPTIAADVVVLTELLARGRLASLPETGLQIRRHAAQFSAQGDAQTTWFDPAGATSGRRFQEVEISHQLLAALRTSPLTPAERALCTVHVLGSWSLRRRRAIARDVFSALRVEGVARRLVHGGAHV